jgi:hypothetical protein
MPVSYIRTPVPLGCYRSRRDINLARCSPQQRIQQSRHIAQQTIRFRFRRSLRARSRRVYTLWRSRLSRRLSLGERVEEWRCEVSTGQTSLTESLKGGSEPLR